MNSNPLKFSIYLPVIILVPFIIISAYNHPALDDWWYAETYVRYGLTGAQTYWFNHYTARFVSNFLMTIAPLSFGWMEGEKVMPIVFLLCLYATFFYVAKTFFKSFTNRRHILALWFTVAYLLIQRDYFECLFWLSSNVVYQFPMLFLMLHVTMVYKIYYEKNYQTNLLIAAIFLSILITGSNEVLGGLILVEAFSLLVVSFYQKRLKTFSIILLSIQLICWIIMFMAPGNWSKINDATRDHVYTFFFIKAISYSVLSIGYYSIFLLKQPSVWLLILLSLPVWKYLLINKLSIKNINYFLLIAFCSFCCAFAVYFISIYPTGILIPPLRVTNVAMVFSFSGISLIVLWFFEKIVALKKLQSSLLKKRYIMMSACFVFAVVTPTKYQQLITDITSGRAKNYNRMMYSRYETIRQSNADTLYLKKVVDLPKTIIALDVTGKVSEDIGLVFDKSNTVVLR